MAADQFGLDCTGVVADHNKQTSTPFHWQLSVDRTQRQFCFLPDCKGFYWLRRSTRRRPLPFRQSAEHLNYFVETVEAGDRRAQGRHAEREGRHLGDWDLHADRLHTLPRRDNKIIHAPPAEARGLRDLDAPTPILNRFNPSLSGLR